MPIIKKGNTGNKYSPAEMTDAELPHCLHGVIVAIETTLTDYRKHRDQLDPRAHKDLRDLCGFCSTLGRIRAVMQKRGIDPAAPPAITGHAARIGRVRRRKLIRRIQA